MCYLVIQVSNLLQFSILTRLRLKTGTKGVIELS